jgi:hypothetical protein
MKKYTAIICLLALASCNKNEPKTAMPEKSLPQSIAPKNMPSDKTPEHEEDPCVAGTPEPIINHNHVANTQFKMLTAQTAEETALLENGDHVAIIIGGCEYYTLRFRFETSRYSDDINDIGAWYANAHQMMSENLAAWGNANIDLKRGLMFLSYYHAKNLNNGQLKYGEEIDYDSTDIRNFVVVDSVEKLDNGIFAVTVVFSRGPL